MSITRTGKLQPRRRGVSRDDATKRAMEDHSESEQYLRLSAQYIIISNLGAAGAMLTFLTAVTTSGSPRSILTIHRTIHWLCGAASFYLFGALICLVSLLAQARAKKFWGYLWEELANFADDCGMVQPDFGHHFAQKAERLESLAIIIVMLSAVMFLFGSIAAISGFVN